MSLVTLLLPSLSRCAVEPTLSMGILARYFARGDRLPDAKPGRDVALRELFTWPGKSLPVAALTRDLDAGDAGQNVWLRTDPAYVRADNLAARMMACGDLDLSDAERLELSTSLRPLLGDAGFPLEAAHASRWYLRCPPGAQLPEFAPPEAVLGDDLRGHLPEGTTGARWRTLLNEVQVLLHNHPVNSERHARGRLPANSLWFWGGGKLPDWIKTDLGLVVSDDVLAQALARRAGVSAAGPISVAALFGKKSLASLLLDLSDGARIGQLESAWLTALDQQLRRGRIRELHLMFLSGERLRVKSAHRWRIWRRVKALRTPR